MKNWRESIHEQQKTVIAFWQKLALSQKILFAAGILAVFILGVFLFKMAIKPDFVPLYTDLEQVDASSIKEFLDEKKAPYKLTDEGTTILVPSALKYQLRLELAGKGLPSGGSVGFEILNNSGFGETESQRNFRYLWALQGELERTIKKLDAVSDVRVHIVVPEPSLFQEQAKDATASVLVELKPGRQLGESQVLGLMNLVASGVEGLKPNKVTVVDVHGNILSEGLAGDGDISTAMLTSSQIKIEQEYEKELQQSLQSMLERIVGPGKCVVRVNASLDFDHVEMHQEDYGDKVVRSEEINEETIISRDSPAEGETGTPTNIPSYSEVTGGEGVNRQQKNNQVTNYEIDLQEENRIVAPGEVKKLSLSIVIDEDIDTQKQQEISDLMAAAAGINPERGDIISVTGMRFNTVWSDQMAKEMEAARKQKNTQNYVLIAAVLAGICLLIFLVMWKSKERSLESVGIGPAMDIDEVEISEEQLTDEERERVKTLKAIQELVKKSPKEVAQLLKIWLKEKPR